MIPRVVNQFLYRTNVFFAVGKYLDARPSISQGGLANLLLTTVLFGMAYGATMGTFGAPHGDRWLQIVFSAIKVPVLLLVGFCLDMQVSSCSIRYWACDRIFALSSVP